MFTRLLLALALLSFYSLPAQEKFANARDLRPEWMVFSNGGLQPLASGDDVPNSIHLQVDPSRYPGHTLTISSQRTYYLLFDGQLQRRHTGSVSLPLDSLRSVSGNKPIVLTVYQEGLRASRLSTTLVGDERAEGKEVSERVPRTGYRDFIIISGLILIVFFAAMIRLQPKLTSDYFSLARIISLREGEDNQAHARFAISSNVWFYIFCSLLLSLLLIIAFNHLPEEYDLAVRLRGSGFWSFVWIWIRTGATILLLLLVKITVIFILSGLFGMRTIAGLHFFNVIRLAMIIASILTAILFVYSIWRGTDPDVYRAFLTVLVVAFVGWVILIYLKLSSRSDHGMFHLFSYICATEVMPLLIAVKVLFQ